jgi:Trypsin
MPQRKPTLSPPSNTHTLLRWSLALSLGGLTLAGCDVPPEGDGLENAQEVESVGSPIIAGAAISAATRVKYGLVDVNGDCSGSLYSRNWVFTALHCVETAAPNGVSLRYVRNSTGASESRTSDQIVFFGSGGALVHVPTPFTTPSTTFKAALSDDFPKPNTALTCFGRGGNGFDQTRGGVTGFGTWRTADLIVDSFLADPSDKYRMKPNSSGQITAPGDSGGPCFLKGTTIQTGLHSVWEAGSCKDPTNSSTCKATLTSLAAGVDQTVGGYQKPVIDDVTTAGIGVDLAAYGGGDCNGIKFVTDTVANACQGKTSCDFKVDHLQLGDPAPNCAKPFTVFWRCAGSESLRSLQLSPEASGKVAQLRCGGITIQRATYGMNWIDNGVAKAGAETAAVAKACNGKTTCDFKVDVFQLGDPVSGKVKNFVIDYVCNGALGGRRVSTPSGTEAHGQTLRLTCP